MCFMMIQLTMPSSSYGFSSANTQLKTVSARLDKESADLGKYLLE